MNYINELNQLRDWFIKTYLYRTKNKNENIDWVLPEMRISFSELSVEAEKLGIKMNPVDLTIWFHKNINIKNLEV